MSETKSPASAALGVDALRHEPAYVLAFDTANEVIAIGVGVLHEEARAIELVAHAEIEARRQSNTQLIPRIDALLAERGIARGDIACVCVGRGPGSFTGVRIAMATAKGIASALEVGLVGVSSLDAVAWGVWEFGARGEVAVVADAMRKEVYPVRYLVDDAGAHRLEADRVVKADLAAEELAECDAVTSGASDAGAPEAGRHTPCSSSPRCAAELRAEHAARPQELSCSGELVVASLPGQQLLLAGDALKKYRDLFAPCGEALPENTWTPTGAGLLLALQAAWHSGECDPFDAVRHNPAFALPVYTRLSDAEENERARAARAAREGAAREGEAKPGVPDASLRTGVQDAEAVAHPSLVHSLAGKASAYEETSPAHHATLHERSILVAPPDEQGISYKPLDLSHAGCVAALESRIMGSDAWNESLVADEIPRRDRTWWAAYASEGKPGEVGTLVGYAGGWVVDGDVQILKVGTDPAWRRRGIARELLAHVAADARNLGAQTVSLEVRAGNEGAQALYRALGLVPVGTRPRYYSDREDALIMQGDLAALVGATEPAEESSRLVAGMELQVDASHDVQATAVGAAGVSCPLILAIESSCDETAAAIVDGEGALVSDVVASQIDFHARFGGVVPEIASRKHIEAICGVCDECLEVAAKNLGMRSLRWRDLSAVAVTYAPGLVGALVVGVAFAKGAAWAADVPLIGVNHLEGHLYANRIGCPDFTPPAVVSLVSGGNTMLVHMKGWGDYETLGTTIADAVGEAFDKVAKALGLGYPGGPVISRYGAKGDPCAIAFPRAMMHSGDLRFSLSGLKTAVVTYINGEREAGRELNVPDICASFEAAVVDVQVAKAKRALEMTGARTLCVGGGVAANPVLRASYEKMCSKAGVRLVLPPLSACGDNAGMIALVALDRFRQKKFFSFDFDAKAHVNLDEPY
ncbi:MAG: tRNA (adenosine(37)-N6)-threonylcarbamoyltransferase complex transferase subunit TsaD [Ellagibacter isourolithinifaciens]|uniref:tRNA (adenosine(37)-N6)-threonylcarbamoyltransferase complex transferase subunit TsaD n=1 Tax=Ellagibacter isourolithinifaciens TaxID=2137581 RepID=UPI002E79045D|nr:tRNA (adenosine(37)-N6)-threonylcarbamoyltransferase complex transferase subunit TsaD [Ellagibacter isourolithinifaciens]MEE1454091.1 tRNA (adenosine(37)-N6)-threonylcarbamoyltransferase complex transferase subunit TsaD [Ellagibacter isourolithinifaciens]